MVFLESIAMSNFIKTKQVVILLHERHIRFISANRMIDKNDC